MKMAYQHNLYQNHDTGDLHLITWRDLATSNTIFETLADGLANDKFLADMGFTYNANNSNCDVDKALAEIATGLLGNVNPESSYQHKNFEFQNDIDETRITLDLYPENQDKVAFRITLMQRNPYQDNKSLRNTPTDHFSIDSEFDYDNAFILEAVYFKNGFQDPYNVQIIGESSEHISMHDSYNSIMRTIATKLPTHMERLQYEMRNPSSKPEPETYTKNFMESVGYAKAVLTHVRKVFNQVERKFQSKCEQYMDGKYFFYDKKRYYKDEQITITHQQEITHDKLLGQLLLSSSRSLPDLLKSGYTPQTEENIKSVTQLTSSVQSYTASNQLANGLLHLNLTLEHNLQQHNKLQNKEPNETTLEISPIHAEILYVNDDPNQLSVSFHSSSNPEWNPVYTLPVDSSFMGANLGALLPQQNIKSNYNNFKVFLQDYVVPEQLRLLGLNQPKNDYIRYLQSANDLQNSIGKNFDSGSFLSKSNVIEYASFDDLLNEKLELSVKYKFYLDLCNHILESDVDIDQFFYYARNINETDKMMIYGEEATIIGLDSVFSSHSNLYHYHIDTQENKMLIRSINDNNEPMFYYFNTNNKTHLEQNKMVLDTLMNNEDAKLYLNNALQSSNLTMTP